MTRYETRHEPSCPVCMKRWRREHRLTASVNPSSARTVRGRVSRSPAAAYVWVEPDRLWLRPLGAILNEDADDADRWMRFTEKEWLNLRDCVDGYFERVKEKVG